MRAHQSVNTKEGSVDTQTGAGPGFLNFLLLGVCPQDCLLQPSNEHVQSSQSAGIPDCSQLIHFGQG